MNDLSNYVNIYRANWITGKCYNAPSSVTSLTINDTTDHPSYSCTYIPVNQGDIIKITGTGGSGAKLWIYTKEDGSIISRADSSITLNDETLIVPQNAKWLLCNANNSNPHYLIKGETVDKRISNVTNNIQNNVTKFLEVSPSDYENKLAKINVPCSFSIPGNSSWEDLPDSTKAYIFTQFNYSKYNNRLQIIYQYPSLIPHYRLVTNTAVAVNWTIITDSTLTKQNIPADALAVGNAILSIKNNATKFLTVNPTDYENKLAKINVPCSFSISGNSSWEDLPDSTKAYIFTQFKYSSSFMLQTAYKYPTLVAYSRIVSPSAGTVIQDWKVGIEKERSTIYYAIGDSITAGSYSENGSGHAVRDAEWSYPNQIAKLYGITVHNLAVPGAKITEFSAQAEQVNSDATLVTIMGGVNDYGSNTAEIGTINDNANSGTIIGSLKSIITTIANNAPNARIVIIAPMPQKAGNINTRYSLNYKRYNFTFEELFIALKTVAEYFNLELLDCMHSGPVSLLNIETVLSDATHPTKQFENTLTDWMIAHLF